MEAGYWREIALFWRETSLSLLYPLHVPLLDPCDSSLFSLAQAAGSAMTPHERFVLIGAAFPF